MVLKWHALRISWELRSRRHDGLIAQQRIPPAKLEATSPRSARAAPVLPVPHMEAQEAAVSTFGSWWARLECLCVYCEVMQGCAQRKASLHIVRKRP